MIFGFFDNEQASNLMKLPCNWVHNFLGYYPFPSKSESCTNFVPAHTMTFKSIYLICLQTQLINSA